ncbi:unnamed protein product [Mycena citricolor]|uniref:Uncharacterized protein n=1 Tax=Mycena citricolor TaxID=2018698 RepID=A0AAD2HDK8_9AGAR|nr:unnamed protein product [Mycena citricolor]
MTDSCALSRLSFQAPHPGVRSCLNARGSRFPSQDRKSGFKIPRSAVNGKSPRCATGVEVLRSHSTLERGRNVVGCVAYTPVYDRSRSACGARGFVVRQRCCAALHSLSCPIF